MKYTPKSHKRDCLKPRGGIPRKIKRNMCRALKVSYKIRAKALFQMFNDKFFWMATNARKFNERKAEKKRKHREWLFNRRGIFILKEAN